MNPNFRRLYRVPLLLAFLTTGGLFFALVADGWADWLSCALLTVPLALSLRLFFNKTTKTDQPKRPEM